MSTPAVVAGNGGITIHLRIQPKASRNEVLLEADGRLRVAVTAPPVDGAANSALLLFMARFLGVKRHKLTLKAGERSREKTIFLADADFETIAGQLSAAQRHPR